MRLDDNVQAAGADEAAEQNSVSESSKNRDGVNEGGWVLLYNETRRETYYARGKLNPWEAMTSAMQIVAERETPTRQWTRVAVPSDLPRPTHSLSARLFTNLLPR
jgi:hypothetical protein